MNDNLVAISAFEKKQEERIAQIQEKFQAQLKVVVDEVGQENQELSRPCRPRAPTSPPCAPTSTPPARRPRPWPGAPRAAGPMQQIADPLAAVQGQVQELAKHQEAPARPRAARPAGGGEQHTVRAGETLTAIAARYGVSVQALMDRTSSPTRTASAKGRSSPSPSPDVAARC